MDRKNAILICLLVTVGISRVQAATWSTVFTTWDGIHFTETNDGAFYGSVLEVGDTVELTYRTQGLSHWLVWDNYGWFQLMSQGISPGALREGIPTYRFYYRGDITLETYSTNHTSFFDWDFVGVYITTLEKGLLFDRVIMSYTMPWSEAPVNTLTENYQFVGIDALTRGHPIAYVRVSEVPLPPAAWLFGSIVAGWLGMGRGKGCKAG